MRIEPFKLERFFAQHEFTARYLLSASDCESWALPELLDLAPRDTLALWDHLRLGYTESQGHPVLRQEIANLYESVSAEQVLVAAPEEAIFILMHALVGPGDHVIVLTPAYQSLYEVARSAGAAVTCVELELDRDRWHLNFDRVAASVTPRTRMLVLNFPHNPTGFLPWRNDFERLVQLARDHRLYLLGDEMYRFLEYEEEMRLPAACDVYERGISLGGLSKSFGLPGLRIGWLATRQTHLLQRWITIKDYTTICSSAPSEILAIMALRAADTLLERNLGIIRDNLALAKGYFGRHSDLFNWIPPQAGPVAFPAWTGPGTVEHFCQKLLDDRGLMIVAGSLFDYTGKHFRVGLGRRNFPDALRAMQL